MSKSYTLSTLLFSFLSEYSGEREREKEKENRKQKGVFIYKNRAR